MKINTISSNNNTPAFKAPVVPYPEFLQGYNSEKAAKADVVTSDPISALAHKLARAYRLLFTPEISASAQSIKKGIDIVFDDAQVGKALNKVA